MLASKSRIIYCLANKVPIFGYLLYLLSSSQILDFGTQNLQGKYLSPHHIQTYFRHL